MNRIDATKMCHFPTFSPSICGHKIRGHGRGGGNMSISDQSMNFVLFFFSNQSEWNRSDPVSKIQKFPKHFPSILELVKSNQSETTPPAARATLGGSDDASLQEKSFRPGASVGQSGAHQLGYGTSDAVLGNIRPHIGNNFRLRRLRRLSNRHGRTRPRRRPANQKR